MSGLVLRVLIAVAPAIALAPPAAAQQVSYGGGLQPTASQPRGYAPTLGVTLQPRGDRIAVLFDTSLLCGGVLYDATGRRVVPFVGGNFSARRTSTLRLPDGRLRFSWRLRGTVSGSVATGSVRITGTRRANGRRRACRAKPVRRFEARVPAAPAGAPAQPRPRGGYVGLSDLVLADGLTAPVVLRATRDGRKVAARWHVLAPCGRGPRAPFTNFTPATAVRPDGTFARSERFTVRYADALVRYRARFAGHFAGDGASGTLQLTLRVYNRSGRRLLTRCDTRERSWSAVLAGAAAPL